MVFHAFVSLHVQRHMKLRACETLGLPHRDDGQQVQSCQVLFLKVRASHGAHGYRNLRKHVVETRSFATILTPHLERRYIVYQICNMFYKDVLRLRECCIIARTY